MAKKLTIIYNIQPAHDDTRRKEQLNVIVRLLRRAYEEATGAPYATPPARSPTSEQEPDT
jgi:hypothetical protein